MSNNVTVKTSTVTVTPVYAVGRVLEFTYNGKVRRVRVDSTRKGYRYPGLWLPCVYSITGWDMLANYPTGGYRTFIVSKIQDVRVIALHS